MEIADLVRQAKLTGWASSVLPTHQRLEYPVRSAFTSLGMTPVPTRAGESEVAVLRPTAQTDANPASLSAQVGLGQQPLHTDGAHMRRPPEIVALWCTEPSATPTRLWTGAWDVAQKFDSAGIFMVQPGGTPWLTRAVENQRLRFDPGCMTPCDAMARRLDTTLRNPSPDEVMAFEWNEPGKILVVDNRRMLHGRGAVDPADIERALNRIALYEEE
ncbi:MULTISPECIES: TauD/TfdA family dioxygenase [unclassified Isoptericola]|uniref:TauD/TfdA family dioxygenase n=1 Tax=unclassified Isoptericola TaxID=2623355 RepID=UPI003658B2B4